MAGLRSLRVITVLAILAIVIVSSTASFVSALAEETGPATDKIIFKRVPLEQVVDAITAGQIDVYIFGLRPAQARQLMGNPNIRLYTAPSGIVDIILNPAPVAIAVFKGKVSREEAAKALGVDPIVIARIDYDAEKDVSEVHLCAMPKVTPEGVELKKNPAGLEINPFCFKEIRFAMNYLIDRDYIVSNIYQGFAIPMYAPYSSADPTYTAIVDMVAKYKFSYNPQLVDTIVTEVLTKAGAVKRGGRWLYNGKPIKIIGIVRVEDERREIGDLFASQLKKLGFEVVVEHLKFGEAITRVYVTDPFNFQWSFYTEGWGKGALDRWDPWAVVLFAAPWYGFMPGWQQAGWWQYKNDTIDELTKPLALGGFKSKEEFIEKLRTATEMAIQEAVRIFIAATQTIFPARADLQGVTLDLGAGLRSPFNGREWRIPGKTTIVVGHLHVWTSRTVWNPWGGFTDVYSVDPSLLTYDPSIWRHPFNGEPIPFRVTYEVVTAGPEGKLPVPKDAVWWDPEKNEWVPAHELGRTEATSKVVFDLSKLIGAKWHHGMTITMADIAAYIAEWLEIAYDKEKSSLESAIAAPQKEVFDRIVAYRFLPEEKKLEVYLNYWHFDPNYIADYASMTFMLPAEIVAMSDYLAFTLKKYALSDERSKTEKIPQLNLVLAEQVSDYVKALEDLKAMYDEYKGYFTINGKVLMTRDEWVKRISKAIQWIEEFNNAWISQGPFKVVRFDKDAQVIELEAFRDPTYPFKPGDWYFGEPVKTVIEKVFAPIVSPGETTRITVTVRGIPPIHVLYLLRDPTTGYIIASGEAEPTTGGVFLIMLPPEVTSKLEEYSAYELSVIAFSEEVTLPYELSTVLQTTAAIAKRIGGVQEQVKAVQEQVSSLQERIKGFEERIQEQIRGLEERLGTLVGEQVAAALRELGAGLSELGSELRKGLSELGTRLGELGKSLSEASSKLDEVSSKLDEVSSRLAIVSKTASEASETANEAVSAANAAASAANMALAVSIINLILLLVVIYMVVKRRS